MPRRTKEKILQIVPASGWIWLFVWQDKHGYLHRESRGVPCFALVEIEDLDDGPTEPTEREVRALDCDPYEGTWIDEKLSVCSNEHFALVGPNDAKQPIYKFLEEKFKPPSPGGDDAEKAEAEGDAEGSDAS
jgi:hypothetical protein